MKHSDKTFMGMTTSGKNAEDVMAMCAIPFGEDFESHPVVVGNTPEFTAGLGRDHVGRTALSFARTSRC